MQENSKKNGELSSPWEGKEVDDLGWFKRQANSLKIGDCQMRLPWEGKEVDNLVDSAEELVTAEMRL